MLLRTYIYRHRSNFSGIISTVLIMSFEANGSSSKSGVAFSYHVLLSVSMEHFLRVSLTLLKIIKLLCYVLQYDSLLFSGYYY